MLTSLWSFFFLSLWCVPTRMNIRYYLDRGNRHFFGDKDMVWMAEVFVRYTELLWGCIFLTLSMVSVKFTSFVFWWKREKKKKKGKKKGEREMKYEISEICYWIFRQSFTITCTSFGCGGKEKRKGEGNEILKNLKNVFTGFIHHCMHADFISYHIIELLFLIFFKNKSLYVLLDLWAATARKKVGARQHLTTDIKHLSHVANLN